MGDTILYRSTNGVGVDIPNLKKYKVMSILINEADSNPGTSCTYADDAVDMPWGATDEAIAKWHEFFQYRPCLFAGGELRGYLNPADYTKFENGSPSGITTNNYSTRDCVDTTGKYLRVAIEIPKMGFSISRSGSTLKVSVTNYPNKEGYSYKAFLYNEKYYNHLYVDAGQLDITTSYNSGSAVTYIQTYPGNDTTNIYDFTESSDSDYTKDMILKLLRSDKYGDKNRHFLSFYENTLLQCMSLLQLKTTAGYYSIFEENLLGDMGLISYNDTPVQPPRLFYRRRYSTYSSSYDTDGVEYTLFGITSFCETRCRTNHSSSSDMYTDEVMHGYILDGVLVKDETTLALSTNGKYNSSWKDSTGYTEFSIHDVTGSSYSYITNLLVDSVYGNNELCFVPQSFNGSSSTHWMSSFIQTSDKDNDPPFALTSGATVYHFRTGMHIISSNIFSVSFKPLGTYANDIVAAYLRATTLM